MISFLVQKINGEIRNDFCLALLDAVDFQYWRDHDAQWKIYFTETPCSVNDSAGMIPVGTLEFVYTYMEELENVSRRRVKPVGIPQKLFKPEFLKRKCRIASRPGLDLTEPSFVKSNDQYKGFQDIVVSERTVPDGNYLVSEVVDIESEWRAFVYKGKLVGLQNYLGDFMQFPDVPTIQAMIAAYTDCPLAYTLDVGVNGRGTFIIEVHPFVSCGLYGFSDNRILPQMFRVGYDWMLHTAKGTS